MAGLYIWRIKAKQRMKQVDRDSDALRESECQRLNYTEIEREEKGERNLIAQ